MSNGLPFGVVRLSTGHVRYRCAMRSEVLANYEIRMLVVVMMDSIQSNLKSMGLERGQPTNRLHICMNSFHYSISIVIRDRAGT